MAVTVYLFLIFSFVAFSNGEQFITGKFNINNLADTCIEKTIHRLSTKLRDMQQKQTIPSNLPFTFAKDKGLYESDVKLYFHGSFEFYLIREIFSIFDNNMFASAWITSAILEAYQYGNAPKPSEEQIMRTVDALSRYEDKNSNLSNSIRTFWPQIYNNTIKVWQSTPKNLLDFFNMTFMINWNDIYKILEDLGQDELVNVIKILINER